MLAFSVVQVSGEIMRLVSSKCARTLVNSKEFCESMSAILSREKVRCITRARHGAAAPSASQGAEHAAQASTSTRNEFLASVHSRISETIVDAELSHACDGKTQCPVCDLLSMYSEIALYCIALREAETNI